MASITLTIILAHITFIMAEVISSFTLFGNFTLHISPIISTTIASLVMGNYGRARIHPEAEAIVSSIWELFAFMANSLIFILIGVLMVEARLFEPILISAILITVLLVAFARALSVYPIVGLYNLFQNPQRHIQTSWQHLLAWGSLRGALAVTMVLLIPDSLFVPGWDLASSPKEFLLAITVGCIAATLFIKATTIKQLVNYFKLDRLTEIEEVEYQEARALMHHKVSEQLVKYEERGYIDSAITQELLKEHAAAFKHACKEVSVLSHERQEDLAFRVLRIYAIGIEKRNLKILYDHNEVTESVFRRIQGKLKLQLEAIEDGDLAPDVTIHADGRDILEHLFTFAIGQRKAEQTFAERYMYYRAQAIISRKVLKELSLLKQASANIFTDEAVTHVTNLYNSFKQNSERKLYNLSATDEEAAKRLAGALAEASVHSIEENVLSDIFRKELITQKLFIALSNETKADRL